MSNDQDRSDLPPPFGTDDDQPDNSMFQSAMVENSTDVPLDDNDDNDEPFGSTQQSARTKTPTNTTNTIETYTNVGEYAEEKNASNNEDVDVDDDPFGEKENQSTTPVKQETYSYPSVTVKSSTPTTPVKQETPLYPSANARSSTPTTPIKQETPLHPSANVKSSTPTTPSSSYSAQAESIYSIPAESSIARKPVPKRLSSDTIEITISNPSKVGDGMSAYMVYRITTKTNMSAFKNREFSVNRRFSDFLGLHTKLIHKYLQMGIIIPIPPEKDSIGAAKVKISNEDSIPSDFIDRRRALLERYLNRLSLHDKIISDIDVREFLEMAGDLPKSKDTAALSGAGVLRAFSTISNSVTKLTTKTSEQDQWFEEQHALVIDLQVHLKHSYNQFSFILQQRKEAGHNLKQFTIALNHLATTEEHPPLSSALTELANLQEKIEQINTEYAYAEYSTITELLKEYVSLLDMVQLTFNERIKVHQQWLNAEDLLRKAREKKTKLEQSVKSADKLPQAEKDVVESDARVTKCKDDFENISAIIKEEMASFEQTRISDFKQAIKTYLSGLLEQQEKILQLWEHYLPEANKISI